MGSEYFSSTHVIARTLGGTSRRNPRYPGIVLNFCRPSLRLGAFWRWEILSCLDAAKSSAAFDKAQKNKSAIPGYRLFPPGSGVLGQYGGFWRTPPLALWALRMAGGVQSRRKFQMEPILASQSPIPGYSFANYLLRARPNCHRSRDIRSPTRIRDKSGWRERAKPAQENRI